MDVELFTNCWRVFLPRFHSHSNRNATLTPAIARTVLLSIAEHDGEFMPYHVLSKRASCHEHVAGCVARELLKFGLVDDLGPDFDAPPGQRRGGYASKVCRLSVNRAKLNELLSIPKAEIERLAWRPRCKRRKVTA